MEKSSQQLHQILSLRPNLTKEEINFLEFYNNQKTNESLLILEKNAFIQLESIFKGDFTLDKGVYKSVLEYAFTQSLNEFDAIQLYIFALIKDYASTNTTVLEANPFAPCLINIYKLTSFLKIDPLPVEQQYNYLKHLMHSIYSFTLNVTIVPDTHISLNLDNCYSLKIIENFTFPTFSEFSTAIGDCNNNISVGFRFIDALSDVINFCIYDSSQFEANRFIEPTSKFS